MCFSDLQRSGTAKEGLISPYLISDAVRMYFTNPAGLREISEEVGQVRTETAKGALYDRAENAVSAWSERYAVKWYQRVIVNRNVIPAVNIYDKDVVITAFRAALAARLDELEAKGLIDFNELSKIGVTKEGLEKYISQSAEGKLSEAVSSQPEAARAAGETARRQAATEKNPPRPTN